VKEYKVSGLCELVGYFTPNKINIAPKINNPSLPQNPIPVFGTKVNIKETTPQSTATPFPLTCIGLFPAIELIEFQTLYFLLYSQNIKNNISFVEIWLKRYCI
jgi:hypothetical protein